MIKIPPLFSFCDDRVHMVYGIVRKVSWGARAAWEPTIRTSGVHLFPNSKGSWDWFQKNKNPRGHEIPPRCSPTSNTLCDGFKGSRPVPMRCRATGFGRPVATRAASRALDRFRRFPRRWLFLFLFSGPRCNRGKFPSFFHVKDKIITIKLVIRRGKTPVLKNLASFYFSWGHKKLARADINSFLVFKNLAKTDKKKLDKN